MWRLEVLITCLYLSHQAHGTCYFFNGTASDEPEQQPCNDNAGAQSMCCHLGGQNPDTCTSDGLCIAGENNLVFRGGCTDPTWKDPACLQICVTGKDQYDHENADIFPGLYTCADGSICCFGADNDELTCCNARNGKRIVDGVVVDAKSVTSTTSTSSPSGSSSPSTQATPSPIQAAQTNSSNTSNTGAIVGGVVGGVAGIAALSLAFWYFMIRRNTRQQNLPQSYESFQTEQKPFQADIQELRDEPREVPAGEIRQELDGRRAYT